MEQIGAATRDGWNQRNDVSAHDDALAAWHQLEWPVGVRSEPAIGAVMSYFGVNADRARQVLGWVLQHGRVDSAAGGGDGSFADDGPDPKMTNEGGSGSESTRATISSQSVWQRFVRWFRD